MDAINQMITWLEANWGTAIFGTVSLGTVVTTLVILAKQWIGNKAQGTKYEAMWNSSQDTFQNGPLFMKLSVLRVQRYHMRMHF